MPCLRLTSFACRRRHKGDASWTVSRSPSDDLAILLLALSRPTIRAASEQRSPSVVQSTAIGRVLEASTLDGVWNPANDITRASFQIEGDQFTFLSGASSGESYNMTFTSNGFRTWCGDYSLQENAKISACGLFWKQAAMVSDGRDSPLKSTRVMTGPEISLDALLQRIRQTPIHATLPENEFMCTHCGTFHADEAMACVMLKCLPEYADLSILRTRNQSEIDKAAIVVDVGGTYDDEKQRYDHHQKNFTSTYPGSHSGIKLSSAGLIYKHYGPRIVEALCGKLDSDVLSKIVCKTYDSLVLELDAVDNGEEIADAPRYQFVTHLSARIGRLNPSWQEKHSPEIENARFKKATELAAQELFDVIDGYCNSWLPAYSIVSDALIKRTEVHPSREILKLPQPCPWMQHLFDLEAANQAYQIPLTKFVVFPDSKLQWRVQAVRQGHSRYRLPLPTAWCGLHREALDEITGIPGGVFVHANGFIGGHTTELGALALASKALDMAERPRRTPSKSSAAMNEWRKQKTEQAERGRKVKEEARRKEKRETSREVRQERSDEFAFAGEILPDAKDAKMSAAKHVLGHFTDEMNTMSADTGKKKRGVKRTAEMAGLPEDALSLEASAGLTQLRSTGYRRHLNNKFELNLFYRKIIRRIPTKGDKYYVTKPIDGGGWQSQLQLPVLPQPLNGTTWTGEVCLKKQAAEQSVAGVALQTLLSDETLVAKFAERPKPASSGKGKGKGKGKFKGEKIGI